MTTQEDFERLVDSGDLRGAFAALNSLINDEVDEEHRESAHKLVGTLEGLYSFVDGLQSTLTHLSEGDLDASIEKLRDRMKEASHESGPTELEEEVDSHKDVGTRRKRVAIVSLLFNWPSTGGGTIHTAETAQFLAAAGYDVVHLSARYDEWGIGLVQERPLYPVTTLEFDRSEWNQDCIRDRFRSELEAFDPDFVIITDSWNSKPLLAEACGDYPYLIRLAAQECLCPMNNVRLLFDQSQGFYTCPANQLTEPMTCKSCVASYSHASGGLHALERELVSFDSPEYSTRVSSCIAKAHGVLVVNPLVGRLVEPFARSVHVVPSGFNPERFDIEIVGENETEPLPKRKLLFAGLTSEPMKGFEVALAACEHLYQSRQDFELLHTDEKDWQRPFCRGIGWKSQAELPQIVHDSDIVLFPTVAEEGVGRTAIEDMAMGRPVVASRIGGLMTTVVDGETGLLFEPQDSEDLASKIGRILDDSQLAKRLGRLGRRRFEQHYTWDSIIRNHYSKILGAVEVPKS